MLDLMTLQSAMAQALLDGDFAGLEPHVRPGPVSAAEALGLHRNTVLYALSNALRLTFPTVDALVGEAFFDQAALAFVAEQPPARACLTGYGANFADFLDRYAPAADLPYLADVARLDALVETVGQLSLEQDGVMVDLGQATLTLDASLGLLSLNHPASAIRDAIETGDDAALARLDPAPGRFVHVLWRTPSGAAIRSLRPGSAAFLGALLAGGDADSALEAALAESDDLTSLQTEILTAPFARLTINAQPDTDR